MATAAQRDRLRRDIGADATTMLDAEADALFDEAAESYSDASVSGVYTRVLALRGYVASKAKLASYTQNEESEDLSDIFKHLTKLLDYWESELTKAILAAEEAEYPPIKPIPPSGSVKLRAVF